MFDIQAKTRWNCFLYDSLYYVFRQANNKIYCIGKHNQIYSGAN